jgi:hypothetical protein
MRCNFRMVNALQVIVRNRTFLVNVFSLLTTYSDFYTIRYV